MDKEYYKDFGKMLVRESVKLDCWAIGERLRSSDEDEVWASNHVDGITALYRSFMRSPIIRWTITDDQGIPVAMAGVATDSLISTKGRPWMLATPELEKIYITFLRHSRYLVGLMFKEYPVLENWADARNTRSLSWLEWCGFRIHNPEPYGMEGLPFHKFDMRRD